MKATIAAWNIQEGLAIPARSRQLVEGIKQLDADVITLSDAYWPGNPLHTLDMALVEEAKADLDAEGYSTFELAYEDDNDPYPSRYMLGLARVACRQSGVNLDGRNALAISVVPDRQTSEKELQVYGVHLDDRSESRRVAQAYAILNEFDTYAAQAVIGDFNSLNKTTISARIIGSTLGTLDSADHISRRVPDRIRAVASKLGGMASGTTLDVVRAAGLQETDDKPSGTFPSRFPLLQLDRCMVTPGIEVHQQRQPHRAGSDHRAIKVSLTV